MTTQYEHLFIGGRFVAPAGADVIEVRSPHDGELVGSVPAATPRDVDVAVQAARASFDAGVWRDRTPGERIAVIGRLAELYGERMSELAVLITREVGSTIAFGSAVQAPAPLGMMHAFSALAGAYPFEEVRRGLAADPIVRSEAVGVVAAIGPWNTPLATLVSKLVPALLAGCSVVAKPPPETPLDGMVLAELLAEAGVPQGVVSILPGGPDTGEHLIRHPEVDKVAFTGSVAAGRRIGAICGEQLKRCTLELGGKSAAIVLDDADVAATVAGLEFASLLLNGQACIAQTRIFAPASRHDELVDALAEAMRGMPVGDPMDPATAIGPLVSERQRERVHGYIELGLAEGARAVVGGTGRPAGLDTGHYVRPTLFVDATNDMRVAREEIFGPVLTVIPYESEAQAVEFANDSPYGLAGSVWTSDVERGLDVARRVRTGTFGINQYTYDFVAPFGGFKASGIGREYGVEGFREYLELKAIYPPAVPVDVAELVAGERQPEAAA